MEKVTGPEGALLLLKNTDALSRETVSLQGAGQPAATHPRCHRHPKPTQSIISL